MNSNLGREDHSLDNEDCNIGRRVVDCLITRSSGMGGYLQIRMQDVFYKSFHVCSATEPSSCLPLRRETTGGAYS